MPPVPPNHDFETFFAFFIILRYLQKPPESLGQLSLLEELDLGGCAQLCELPPSFSQLRSLRRLKLHCMYFLDVPAAVFRLTGLRHLALAAGITMIELPASLAQLTNLETLRVHGFRSLTRLPEGISNLKELQVRIGW